MIVWATTVLFAAHYQYLFFLKSYGFDIKNHWASSSLYLFVENTSRLASGFFIVITTSSVIYEFIKHRQTYSYRIPTNNCSRNGSVRSKKSY